MSKVHLTVELDDGVTIVIPGVSVSEVTARYGAFETRAAIGALESEGLNPQPAQDAQSDSEPSDPWGSPPQPAPIAQPHQSPPQQAPAPSQQYPPQQAAQAMNAQPPQSGVLTIQSKSGLQIWTINPPGAPVCGCGLPSAQVRGTSANGRQYTAYRCVKGAGQDAGYDWRQKCQFNKWA